MIILCEVNQVECLRRGLDAPSSTVKIEVDPKLLSEEQRNLIAKELHSGLRFPGDRELSICPPTYEGFLASVNYAVEAEKRRGGTIVQGSDTEKALKQFRDELIKAAIEKSERPKPVEEGISFEDLAAKDPRAAIGRSWTALARTVLRKAKVRSENLSPLSQEINASLKRFESNTDVANDLILMIKQLQIQANMAVNQSKFAYDPTPEEAQQFIRLAEATRADLGERPGSWSV